MPKNSYTFTPWSLIEDCNKETLQFYIMSNGTPSMPENIVLSRSIKFPVSDRRFYDVALASAKRMVDIANSFA